ncbi:MAG: DUF3078 domain-containing protein [Paludibacter sp.]|nr:DUF3078 domain-containing protein [Paludibacter sp.]
MNLKFIFAPFLLALIPLSVFSATGTNQDSLVVTTIEQLVDVTFQEKVLHSDTTRNSIPDIATPNNKQTKKDLTSHDNTTEKPYEPLDIQQILLKAEQNRPLLNRVFIKKRFLETNPFFIDLLFHGYSTMPPHLDSWSPTASFSKDAIAGLKLTNLIQAQAPEQAIQELRETTIRRFAAYNPHLIAYKIHDLPDVTDFINFELNAKPIDETVLLDRNIFKYDHQKLYIEKIKRNPWTTKSNALLQFSQNYISKNWYQGGSDNISILGLLNGTFNYDDKKNIQWDNFAEWRMGFNSVDGDTLRLLNTNDDILRATSKLGIKAGGNWFYSGSVDFSTHFFHSYKAINSNVMKAKFLTPVRFNVNVGLDYKYKKLFSLMFSPISYKFIYANDTLLVDQKSFGIPKGENILSQVGSSFRAQLSYSPVRELQIDSKLSFYTNYEKFEIDWEIVGNFKFNRFLSTRLSLNPRYDNTVLTDERAMIQFKQLLTFGLSYKLL